MFSDGNIMFERAIKVEKVIPFDKMMLNIDISKIRIRANYFRNERI